jgi:nucleoside-diphosphate-sugar epimerase
VFVTGAAGYIGSILCEHLLAAGYRVTGLDTLVHGQSSLLHLCGRSGFDFIYGDARDEALVAGCMKQADVVIPLAAVVGAPACDREPELAAALNRDAVRAINRMRSREQLIVFPNTNSGYGTKSGADFCTEDTPLEPISVYGRTKCDAELAVLDSPNAITLRLATVFGVSPRMRLDLLVNHFVYAAVTDGYLVLFEKDFRRNFVHVRDVADCFVYAIEHAGAMAGRPYNVGLDAANMSKEQLALAVKKHVPRLYLHFAEVGSDPDKRDYIVSNQRLRDAGFEARRSIDDGIDELLRAYRMLPRSSWKNV